MARFFREEVWEIATPGWRLERRGEDQYLVADTGVAAKRVLVEFPVHTDHLVKEYEFFEEFTDGSLAIYTGHLYVTDETDYLRRVELVPRNDEHVVVRGNLTRGRTIWDDPDGDGTYVYFGGIEPLETEEMIAIVDPGAPAWLVQQMQRLLPEMFAMYTEGFGEPLPWKPVVLLNFENVERGGLSSGGGTLTGLVQMSATGSAWNDATPASSEHLQYLVAHEAAHLWNGQLHTSEDSADSWMHEGSADAFAELALLRTGTIDAARLAERRTEALNHCVLGLGDGSLYDSIKRSQFRNYYACGNLLAVWSVAMLHDPAEPDRLFDVWRAVFANADPVSSNYDRDSYFRALESLGVETEALDRLRAFLDETLDDPAIDIVEFLGSAGIEIVVLDRPSPAVRRELAGAALGHLMGQACDGRVSFNREWPRLRTIPIEGCERFGREMRILTIQGHDVDSDGDRALDSTAERCRTGQPVTFGLEDGGKAAIPCSAPPPAPPPPLAFPELHDDRIVITKNLQQTTDDAEFVFEDARNFIRAMELVDAGGDLVPTLEKEYFGKASAGLKQMVIKYPFTAEDLARAIEKYPEKYGRIARNVEMLQAREPELRDAYRRYKEFAPDIVFPPTFFLVDRHRGIGSGSPDGQLISIESKTDESIGRIETLLIHELTHFQQLVSAGSDEFYAVFGPKKSLLALTIREGTAEFIADRITNRMTQEDTRVYASDNEAEIWQRFQQQMLSDETGDWMWSKPADPEQPRDLAYGFGARIVEAYYENASDKREALQEIFAVVDYRGFLEKSEYAKKFTPLE